jgi:hypothetical protein
MWNDEKQRQLDALREKEFAGTLTADEQQQLELLFAEIEAEEEEMLRPAMERMERECQQKQAEIARLKRKNDLLADLAAQREQLLQRARAALQEFQNDKTRLPSNTFLQELQSEHERLCSEYERALAEETRA